MNELDNYLNEEAIPSIEELLTENVEQAELIQKLLFEKSELQQIVQEQKLTLQELKEKIVTLNNSDLQLKKAEQILRESKQKLAEAVRLEKATIEEDNKRKQLYEKGVRELTLRESEAKYIVDKQNQVLNEKAKQMTSSVRESMEKQHQKREKALCEAYKLKEFQLHAVTIGGLLYSFYVTLLAVITTVRFKFDLLAVIEGICGICMMTWENLLAGANTASNICNKIPNEVVAMVLSWVVRVLIILFVLAVVMGGIGWGVYKIFRFYQSHFADRVSVVVSLISFSLLVWFGDYIGEIIKWNLVGVFLIVQVAYIALRIYAESRNV